MLFRPTANKIFITMPDSVKLIECPRDAWQGLRGQIPADLKVDYLKALISAGFKHIDAASFVSPNAVPQMADSEAVLKERSEEHTSELQSHSDLVCRLLLEKKKRT